MKGPAIIVAQSRVAWRSKLYGVWRALKGFLGIPLLMLVGFTGLGFLLIALDRATPGWLRPLRSYLQRILFTTGDSTSQFLGTVVGGMFTQVSMIITMLLLVLQQTATKMGNSVYDQFMSRHRNQVFAGYVTGTLVLALGLLAAASQDFNPVLGAAVVFILVFIQMALFVWFLYSIIRQMRPETIVSRIHDGIDRAHQRQLAFLNRVRAHSISVAPVQTRIKASENGFVGQINLDGLKQCFQECGDDVEVILHANIGDSIAYYDDIAEVKANDRAEAEKVARCAIRAYRFVDTRSIENDPAYGLQELEMIGWAESSTARHNPETGLMVLHALRDLVSRWSKESDTRPQTVSKVESRKLPVVYTPEYLVGQAMDVLQSLAAASSESLQHQIFTEAINTIASVYPYLTPEASMRADDTLRRILTAMGDHVPTRDLDVALHQLVEKLHAANNDRLADRMEEARVKMMASVGTVASRSSRLKSSSNGQ